MFEMTFEQQQAFKDAASGTSALVFNHIILMVIGLFATIWLTGKNVLRWILLGPNWANRAMCTAVP